MSPKSGPTFGSDALAAVIGGGPAGLIAAEMLGKAGVSVTVYDRMPSVGRKLLMAGRGGLNLTHSESLERFVARYAQATPHLKGFIGDFRPEDLRAWSEGLGQETFVGSSGRVFPKAFKASPLLRAWLARLQSLGVHFALRHEWQGWDADNRLVFIQPNGSRVTVPPKATVLALGGASWPRLGSDGAWVKHLASHARISPLRAANVGFTIAWSEIFRSRYEGEPLKRVALTFNNTSVRGEAIVTARGIEGGAIYALSAHIREAILREGSAIVHVDLRPDLTREALAKRLNAPRGGQSTSTFLRKAAGLPPIAIALMREGRATLPETPDALAQLIKAVPLTLAGVGPIERAISTAGGIAFEAVDEHLMLRAKPGVFVAGEMLDWEAPTGGYLLQASFATGVAAAKGALAWLHRQPTLAR